MFSTRLNHLKKFSYVFKIQKRLRNISESSLLTFQFCITGIYKFMQIHKRLRDQNVDRLCKNEVFQPPFKVLILMGNFPNFTILKSFLICNPTSGVWRGERGWKSRKIVTSATKTSTDCLIDCGYVKFGSENFCHMWKKLYCTDYYNFQRQPLWQGCTGGENGYPATWHVELSFAQN